METTFEIPAGAETTRIRFDSKATMESFNGSTRQATGRVTLDPDALAFGIRTRDVPTQFLAVDIKPRSPRREPDVDVRSSGLGRSFLQVVQ